VSAVMAILRREMQAYFVSPIAYTVIVIFLLGTGVGFVRAVHQYSMIPASVIEDRGFDLRNWLIAGRLVVWIKTSLVLCLPALTMRSFTEERRSGTAELLMTSPLTTPQLVLGKYLGTMSVFLIVLGLTVLYPILLQTVGVVEWPSVGTAYLGLFLYGSVVLAVGMLASSLTENQIVALLLTYAMLLPFILINLLMNIAAPLSGLLVHFSLDFGLRMMARGLVDTHHVVLHGAVIFGFLFLSVQVLDSNRWR
jgi:ABC-2 type transport system permease protein